MRVHGALYVRFLGVQSGVCKRRSGAGGRPTVSGGERWPKLGLLARDAALSQAEARVAQQRAWRIATLS